MQRSTFKRQPMERKRSIPTPGTGRGVHAACTDEVVAVPKDAPAKPGKGAPTVAEAEWMRRIVEYGCIACILDGHWPRPAAVHHILRGGRRMGHMYTIPLCDPGHHQGGAPRGMVSRHPWKARFEERYGSEMDLLALMRERLGVPP